MMERELVVYTGPAPLHVNLFIGGLNGDKVADNVKLGEELVSRIQNSRKFNLGGK